MGPHLGDHMDEGESSDKGNEVNWSTIGSLKMYSYTVHSTNTHMIPPQTNLEECYTHELIILIDG